MQNRSREAQKGARHTQMSQAPGSKRSDAGPRSLYEIEFNAQFLELVGMVQFPSGHAPGGDTMVAWTLICRHGEPFPNCFSMLATAPWSSGSCTVRVVRPWA